MEQPLLVGILGAGRIAQGFDSPDRSCKVLSLAHAVLKSPALRLGGFFDIEAGRAQAAEKKWGCPTSPRDRASWLSQPWDVICIATPDAQHAADLEAALGRRPRAIVVEKPATTDPAEAQRLFDRASDMGVPVLVNYPRRYHSGIAAVSQLIASGALTRPIAATFVYSGTAAHSASHMLDLFHTWWGDGWRMCAHSISSRGSLIEMARGSQTMLASFIELPDSGYYEWALRVHCEDGKVELSGAPEMLEISRPRAHPLYPTFTALTVDQSFAMDDEPLLVRLMEAVVATIHSRDVATKQLDRERASQRFSGGVLAALNKAHRAN